MSSHNDSFQSDSSITASNFADNFINKLNDIHGTQESIQALSLWILQHRKFAKSVGKVWYKELKKVHPKRKLTFLYLMNDVVQNSRKKGSEFQKVFGAVLSHSIKDCGKAANSKVRSSLVHLLQVWRERHVFESTLLQQCETLLNKVAPASSTSKSSKTKVKTVSTAVGEHNDDSVQDVSMDDSPAVRDASVGSDDDDDSKSKDIDSPNDDILQKSCEDDLKRLQSNVAVTTMKKELAAQMEIDRGHWPDADLILSGLEFLLHTPSGNADMRQRIARFPKHVVDESYVEKVYKKKDCKKMQVEVMEADLILVDYNKQLSGEIERRRAFHHQLRQFCTLQRNLLVISKERLKEHSVRLRQVQSVREELSAHLARLPDLSSLPDVTGGNLAPLPSVGDLFG